MDKQQEAQGIPPSYNEAISEPPGSKPPGYDGPVAPGYAPPGQGYPAQGQGYPQYPVYQQPYPGTYVQNVQIQQPMLGPQPTTPPQDHMCAAIFVTLCCFWPTGIIAIMKANDSRCAMARQDYASAHIAAKSSKQMINISIIVGIIAFIILGVIIGLYIGLVFSQFTWAD